MIIMSLCGGVRWNALLQDFEAVQLPVNNLSIGGTERMNEAFRTLT